ncbi:MAG: ArsR family transcriptional regulator [Candidatus Cloacimonetes bacterium HGW-Cloacimonetes-1]|jgi:biotin operon repressor|nr:MAG: ArsR family transcriptional regulator [Candidatus Cloacimonetes bacterium HGW-Cloacimonetes-1]
MKAIAIFKALADDSRLQIINLLRGKPHCVEDIAEALKLAVSTVSAHLKKLQQAGMVYATKQQYYSVYHIKKEILEMKIIEILPQATPADEDRLAAWKQKVYSTYIKDGKITRLPSQNKKRWLIYLEIIKLFEADKQYQEREINDLISTVYADYCIVRRELVDEGVLSREHGIYHLVPDYEERPGFYQMIWLSSEADLRQKQ